MDGTQTGKEQPAWLGSFGHVASLPADLRGGVRLSATIWPTTPGKGRQGLVALRIDRWTFALGIGPGGGAMVEVAAPAGARVRARSSLSPAGAAMVRRDGHARWRRRPRGDADASRTLGDTGEARAKTVPPPAGAPEVSSPHCPGGQRPGHWLLQRQA
jgi:hypothetical protein